MGAGRSRTSSSRVMRLGLSDSDAEEGFKVYNERELDNIIGDFHANYFSTQKGDGIDKDLYHSLAKNTVVLVDSSTANAFLDKYFSPKEKELLSNLLKDKRKYVVYKRYSEDPRNLPKNVDKELLSAVIRFEGHMNAGDINAFYLYNAFDSAKSLDVSHLDKESKSNYYKGVNGTMKVIDRLSSMLPHGDSLSSLRVENDAYYKENPTVAGFYERRSISLNQSLIYKESLSRSRQNWVTSFDTPSSAIHEFGHHLDTRYSLRRAIAKEIDISSCKRGVSPYGSTSEAEAFAEAFTLYCLGANPVSGKDYYSAFERAMEKKGLTRFKGCMSSSSKSTNGKAVPVKEGNSLTIKPSKSTNGKTVRSKPSPEPKPTASGRCPNCGAPVGADFNFCRNCGHKLH